MEEDLKDIELFIDFCRAPYNFEHKSDAKSYKELSNKIEHLIKAYKELEEEKKDLKDKLNSSRKANEKLSEKNRNLQIEKETAYSEAINNIIAGVDLDNSFIPVSLVEEKIEEIDQENLGYSENEWYLESEIKGYATEKLQEILEKR